jgi:hypothetical protein
MEKTRFQLILQILYYVIQIEKRSPTNVIQVSHIEVIYAKERDFVPRATIFLIKGVRAQSEIKT